MSFVSGPAPTADPRGERLDRIGVFGTYLFALFALLGISVALVGLLFCVIAFLIRFRHWGLLARDPFAILCLLFILYLGSHSLAFFLSAPTQALAHDIAHAGLSWAKLVLLIPFAYWASGDPDRIRLLLLLALFGFILGLMRKIDWNSLDAAFFRTRFGSYLPSNAFGMFAALGTLGLIAMREKFWGDGRGRIPRWSRILLWGLLLGTAAEGLMLSFSRGSWLSFLIAGALLLLLDLRERFRRSTGATGKQAAAVPLALAALLALLVTAYWDQIQVRLSGEKQVIERVLDGKLEGIQHWSIGIRVLGWRYGIEEWSQHPWFGLGAGSSRERISASGRPELKMYDEYWLPHLHNAYLETLFQLGIVGLALVAAMVWVLVGGVAAERRAGRVPRDLGRFLLAALVFALVWSLFEYRTIRHDWRVFWIIVAGSAYSFRLRTLLEGEGVPLDFGGTKPHP